jgi:hypothetical protein
MTNSPIRKFCESRYRWPIVATATALVALLTLVPAVDEYFDNRTSRSELADELVGAQQTAGALPKFEARMAEVGEQLQDLERRTVDEESVAGFRSRLVDLVRESGCQIRRIEIGAPTARPWTNSDDPLAEAQPSSGKEGATGFSLQRRIVSLGVDGTMTAIQDLLSRLEEEKSLSHPHRLQLQAGAAGGQTVMMELELWLFALARSAS